MRSLPEEEPSPLTADAVQSPYWTDTPPDPVPGVLQPWAPVRFLLVTIHHTGHACHHCRRQDDRHYMPYSLSCSLHLLLLSLCPPVDNYPGTPIYRILIHHLFSDLFSFSLFSNMSTRNTNILENQYLLTRLRSTNHNTKLYTYF